MATKFLAPSAALGIRPIQDNKTDNGLIVNPPRYAQLGGLSGPRKTGGKNKMTVVPPGRSR